MKYKQVNESKISILGYGCMRFPVLENGKIDRIKTFELLDCAYENGVNYYDTAFPYHSEESELVVGEWVKTKERSSICLTTKSPVWKYDTKDGFYEYFKIQLEKLQVEYFDFYLMHALDKERFENLKNIGIIDIMNDLKEKGLVKNIGFSFHDEYEVFDEIIHYYNWDFCQLQLNYMDTNHQAGIKGYELATKLNIPVVVMEPIKGGLLSKVPSEIKEKFNAMHKEWSDSSWALRWCATLENVCCILSGMSTLDQVKDNTTTFKDFIPLTNEELNVVTYASELYNKRAQVPCTGCKYCMPCTNHVNIPNCFKVYNHAYIYDNFEEFKTSYNNMQEENRADKCIECGKCLEECPQKIDIITELKKVDIYFTK